MYKFYEEYIEELRNDEAELVQLLDDNGWTLDLLSGDNIYIRGYLPHASRTIHARVFHEFGEIEKIDLSFSDQVKNHFDPYTAILTETEYRDIVQAGAVATARARGRKVEPREIFRLDDDLKDITSIKK